MLQWAKYIYIYKILTIYSETKEPALLDLLFSNPQGDGNFSKL